MISNNLRLQRVLCLSILALTLAIVFFLFVHQNWEKIDEHINARLSGLKSSKAGVSKSNPPLDFGPNSGSNGSDKKKTSGGNFVIDTNSISGVDWKRFAYIQYVTDEVFLCNSVMIFESLNRLKSKADRLLMYPSQWEEDLNNNTDSFIVRMLKKSRDEYGARLRPVGVMDLGGDRTWAKGFTKLLAFNQTDYDRVLHLDSDAMVLQSMDELFLSPPAVAGFPRAYWIDKEKRYRCDAMILAQPSKHEFERVQKAIQHKSSGDFDMEIMNQLYKDNCLVLPHRPYLLLTGEYKHKRDDHAVWLGQPTEDEKWDGEKIFKETKYLHFSDWPMPKPWYRQPKNQQEKEMPKCINNGTDCTDQKIWLGFYEEFANRRKQICDLDLI